ARQTLPSLVDHSGPDKGADGRCSRVATGGERLGSLVGNGVRKAVGACTCTVSRKFKALIGGGFQKFCSWRAAVSGSTAPVCAVCRRRRRPPSLWTKRSRGSSGSRRRRREERSKSCCWVSTYLHHHSTSVLTQDGIQSKQKHPNEMGGHPESPC
ncbi:hypothetical protein AMECASPLE_039271, partial [Ameca splendens]